jgi:hypothetical protein
MVVYENLSFLGNVKDSPARTRTRAFLCVRKLIFGLKTPVAAAFMDSENSLA